MLDVLISQFSKSMSACFMLNDAARILRIGTIAGGTNTNRQAIPLKVGYTTIGIAVGYKDDKRTPQIVPCQRCMVNGILPHHIIFGQQIAAVKRAEVVIYIRVHRVHTFFLRQRETHIDVEEIAVGLVGFQVEEVFRLLPYQIQVILDLDFEK